MSHSSIKSKPVDPPLSSQDLEGAARLLRSIERMVSRPALVAGARPTPENLVTLAKRIHAFRKKRAQFLHPELFAEPGWDILLALYIAEREGYRMNMSSVCNESGTPDTTALRWLDTLFEAGLARKRPNPLDARSKFVELTPEGLEKLDQLLEQAWESYFPFA